VQKVVHVRPLIKGEVDVKYFLAVNEDPIQVRQRGKKIPHLFRRHHTTKKTMVKIRTPE